MRDTMKLVNICRSPIRRQIMLLAEEVEARGDVLTASLVNKEILKGERLSSASYHVGELAKAGALEIVGGERKRGAYQDYYKPTKAFRASMTDTVALDQIAELIDTAGFNDGALEKLVGIVQATGRPVEA